MKYLLNYIPFLVNEAKESQSVCNTITGRK